MTNNLVMRILNITAQYDDFDEIWWRTDGDYAPVTFLVNCNDLFIWACSDAEPITEDNIDIFEQSYKDSTKADKYGECHATALFCCRVRKSRPQGAFYSYIPESLWPLFNECGPERKTGLGNPHAPGEYKRC